MAQLLDQAMVQVERLGPAFYLGIAAVRQCPPGEFIVAQGIGEDQDQWNNQDQDRERIVEPAGKIEQDRQLQDVEAQVRSPVIGRMKVAEFDCPIAIMPSAATAAPSGPEPATAMVTRY